jgi:hypothetical protein
VLLFQISPITNVLFKRNQAQSFPRNFNKLFLKETTFDKPEVDPNSGNRGALQCPNQRAEKHQIIGYHHGK